MRLSDGLPNPLASHPTNSSRPPRTTHTQTTPPKSTGRRQSLFSQRDVTSRTIAENGRDSISSRDSWIKRLSIRPLSQHGSPRSSLIIEPVSFSFSPNSGAPILSPASPTAHQLAPNVLVKRDNAAESSDKEQSGTLRRRMSKSRMPTLRRPATSHQRSATVQQFQSQGGFTGPSPPSAPKYSLDQQTRPRGCSAAPVPTLAPEPATRRSISSGSWTSYFHSRASQSSSRRSSGRSSEGSPNSQTMPNKRLSLQPGSRVAAFLTKPSLIAGRRGPSQSATDGQVGHEVGHAAPPEESQNAVPSADSTPSKRARRSISQHFTSPPGWISKTGSLRRSKRGSTEAKSGGRRHVSAPAVTSEKPRQPEVKPAVHEIFNPPEPRREMEVEPLAKTHNQAEARKRNSSSPLPPLSRLSSFNIDMARLGLSSSSSTAHPRQAQNPPTSMPASHGGYASLAQSRAVSADRASTIASSDIDARDGLSGDDDDTDFKSETMFDSFRTVASSSRVRTVETPLESMFDESPPSTAGNSKPKRWSIQEILGPALDGKNRIMEEDEGISTPIRSTHLGDPVEFVPSDDVDAAYDSDDSSLEPLPIDKEDFSRPSMDEEDDDDWAREDENALSNHLSPPSSSLNSRGVSPTLRHALASISGNSTLDRDTMSERPRSNIFDWCEPMSYEKAEGDGHSPRPKTVHGKQELDLRGGRSVNRKGPSATHVRSQSVPVVPDPTDTSKSTPKFGTWGLGTKTASEDWDDDFDFEGPAHPIGGKDSATSFSMVVPASIQATQPTVKAHSGQIRELSLLVNDLKRLCRHGKELSILNGPAAIKWKDAENIIALASPDEEDSADDEDSVHSSPRFDRVAVDERFLDEGFDAQSLGHTEDIFDVPEPEMSRTTVVRERQVVRRRSVFSPEDDIFGGGWPTGEDHARPSRPHTPDQSRRANRESAVISTVIEAMQQQRMIATPVKNVSPAKPPNSKLFFDTNSLQELVKRAGHLRDSLSDVVRRAELLTLSPAGTPRRERHSRLTSDGSPAFTRVFTDPASSSPPKNVPKSHSNNTVLSKRSIDSPRMQVMTVS
ncbi:hypothetical protein GQ53DRAFT_724607 [Thozetella sp. PMI_491]|nr:hypothetical protein GQ53DRAFT_724607 [Thozetella sp. PMI_491]